MEHLNVRTYDNQNPLLLPPCIGDYLPEGHLARLVDEVVEGLDLSPLYRKVPSEGNLPDDNYTSLPATITLPYHEARRETLFRKL